MKKLIIILAAAAMTGCGIYKPYTRPEVKTDGLYGTAETADTTTIGNLGWEEMFTDPYLRTLIRQGLENNTDLQSAQWRVKEAEATLKSARLAYLPSFNFAPQGSMSSFDWATPGKTYSIPVTASWQIDIFNGLTNAKRKSKALYLQSKEYEQAVKTQLISGIANLYYTLLMLDGQYEVTEQTAGKWRESVRTMRALKEAGIHVCVDTNGGVWNPAVEELLGLVDLVLLDVKQADPERHRALTGRENAQTLRTAAWLEAHGKPFWLRYVLVPGYSDAEADIRTLGERLGGYKSVERVELLPYHTLGVHKYEAMGLEYRLRDVRENTPEQLDRAAALLREYFPTVIVN